LADTPVRSNDTLCYLVDGFITLVFACKLAHDARQATELSILIIAYNRLLI